MPNASAGFGTGKEKGFRVLTDAFVVKYNIKIRKENDMIKLDGIKTEIPALQATLMEVGDSL